MGAGGGTAVAIVFALGIYFVHKWTGRRGRQVDKKKRKSRKGVGA